MKRIVFYQTGAPDVLTLEDAPLPEPAPEQVRVKVLAAGVNYIDTYHRSGQYAVTLPFVPGQEASGTVDALGDGVTGFAPGERVVYGLQGASYADYVVVPADKLVRVPEALDAQAAAAAFVQGLTAQFLAYDTFPLQVGQTALIHAAAGGVGSLLVQMARLRGAQIIATVSTEEKAALARADGAHHVILYTQQDFEAEVKRLTNGRGVDVVYDSVGKDTFDRSLNCLRPRGMLVLYGQASGGVPPFNPQVLAAKGSLFLTRPTLGSYLLTRAELLERADVVFGLMAHGKLKVRIDQVYPLAQAAEAHRYMEARGSKGKVLLVP